VPRDQSHLLSGHGLIDENRMMDKTSTINLLFIRLEKALEEAEDRANRLAQREARRRAALTSRYPGTAGARGAV
jgi:hypothetical protein